MGAAESTALPPRSTPPANSLNVLRPGRPLHTLLNPSQQLPPDPDAPFYNSLFQDYVVLHHLRPRPLASLTNAALNLPSGPHAAALVAALRAAVHRLRSETAPHLLGALLLARSALEDLRRAAPDDPVCLVLGAGDAERSLRPGDRIDLGKSLVARLLTAALHILHNSNSPASSSVTLAAVDLLLVALADELYVRPTRSEPLSRLLDRYPLPAAVVNALLDVLADATPHADPAALLSFGAEHVPRHDRPVRRPANLALAASASALALQTGFSDAITAISSRLPFPSFASDPEPRQPSSQRQSLLQTQSKPSAEHIPEPAPLHIPDVHPDPYAPYAPETPGMSPMASPDFNSAPSFPTADENHALLGAAARQDERYSQNHSVPTANGSPRAVTGLNETNGILVRNPKVLADHVLVLLAIICGPRPNSPYRKALFDMQNKVGKSSPEHAYSFSKLYDTLGKWTLHPNAALLAYYIFAGNKRFRTFALARTDPDVLLVPLLASLRRRCSVGVAPADAYVPAAILLMLTSDKGFCEAIDAITVAPEWLTLMEDKSRLGSESIAMSGLVLLVCSRVVQQSLVVRRREPDCFLTSLCLATMANVSGDVTNLHALAAERLVSLVEFLGRRRRKAILYAKRGDDMPMAPPPVSDSPRAESGQTWSPGNERTGDGLRTPRSGGGGSFEKSDEFLERLGEFVGLSLEIIVWVLKSRSSVSANRHLVYTLLHREAILDSEHVTEASEQTRAVGHMLRRMVDFFGKYVDEWADATVDTSGRQTAKNTGGGATGISVERVFEVIDKKARLLKGDMFDGLPELRFRYEEVEMAEQFLRGYSWSLATRSLRVFWNVDKAVMPIGLSCFKAKD